MIRRLLIIALLGLAGCASYPTPDPALVRWGQPNHEAARLAAAAQAAPIDGFAFEVAPTGSMEPFLTGGDYAVVDFTFQFKDIKPGMVLVYDANWLDQNMPLVCHMAVEKTGDAWIMTGISNQYSEAGSQAMTAFDYRGRVVAVYTIRMKP